jgi:L-ribulokinase
VREFVASGGLPTKSPLLMQIYADVLGARIRLASSDQSVALGAAILGCVAAGRAATGYSNVDEIVYAMVPDHQQFTYMPDAKSHGTYDALYEMYRELGAGNGPVAESMRKLRSIASASSVGGA